VRNLIILAVIFGVVGLVVGYLLFGRADLTNELIPLNQLFASSDNLVGQIRNQLPSFQAKRQNILICGGAGVVVGVILGFVLRRRR